LLNQILRRIATGLVVLWITLTVVFLGLDLAPGDELDARLSAEAAASLTAEEMQAKRAELGLDRAFPIKYGIWLKKVVTGDLGYSTSEDMDITEVLKVTVGNTAILVFTALFLGTLFGIFFGVLAAIKENTWIDYIVGSIPIFIAGIPGFILSLGLIYTVSVKMNLLPSGYMHSLTDESFLDLVKHMILPVSVLTMVLAAQLVRYTRASMLDVLSSEFIIAAKAKGISNRRVVFNHAFRNALLPVISIIGLHLPEIIAGAVITETVFTWPGMGTLAVRAAGGRDVPMVMGIVIVVAITVVITNLITDIAYTIADPRVRLG
jgi:peptide/nickel transport system permease protein